MRWPKGPQILLPTWFFSARVPKNLRLQGKKKKQARRAKNNGPPRAHFKKCWTQNECGVNGAYAVFAK